MLCCPNTPAGNLADSYPRPPREGDPRTVAVLETPSGDSYRATLENAGWNDQYRSDVAEWEHLLRSEGFSVTRPGLLALGGLTIDPPQRSGAVYGSGQVVMDPIFAASGEAARIKQREAEFGLAFCPVGEWMGEYVLLVAEDGSVSTRPHLGEA